MENLFDIIGLDTCYLSFRENDGEYPSKFKSIVTLMHGGYGLPMCEVEFEGTVDDCKKIYSKLLFIMLQALVESTIPDGGVSLDRSGEIIAKEIKTTKK